MSRQERDHVVAIPGTAETLKRKVVEWICHECDYFEELDEDDDEGR